MKLLLYSDSFKNDAFYFSLKSSSVVRTFIYPHSFSRRKIQMGGKSMRSKLLLAKNFKILSVRVRALGILQTHPTFGSDIQMRRISVAPLPSYRQKFDLLRTIQLSWNIGEFNVTNAFNNIDDVFPQLQHNYGMYTQAMQPIKSTLCKTIMTLKRHFNI